MVRSAVRVSRQGFFEEVRFKHRLEWSWGINPANIWGSSLPGKRTKCKSNILRWEHAWTLGSVATVNKGKSGRKWSQKVSHGPGFYLKRGQGQEQGNDMIRPVFQEGIAGCCVDDGHGDKESWDSTWETTDIGKELNTRVIQQVFNKQDLKKSSQAKQQEEFSSCLLLHFLLLTSGLNLGPNKTTGPIQCDVS